MDSPHLVRIGPGERGRAIMPHSEVCIHLGVAGKEYDFLVVGNERNPEYAPSVQILNPDGSPLSFPIGAGEGGLYYDYGYRPPGETREYYYYASGG